MRVMGWGLALVAMALAIAGCSEGGSLASGGTVPNLYVLPTDFAETQPVRGWSFAQLPAYGEGQEQALTWGALPAGTPYSLTEGWHSDAGTIITKSRLHPGSGQNAVINWRVPRTGLVELTAVLTAMRSDAVGDGFTVSIYRNGTLIGGPKSIANVANSPQSIGAGQSMQAGDTLSIRVNPLANNTNDWMSYQFKITVR